MNLRRRPPRHAAEMLLQWLTLVCLAVVSMATSPAVMLDEEPRSAVTLPSGSALSFKCGLNTSGYERIKLIWLFNPNESSAIKAKNISNFTNYFAANGSWRSSGGPSNGTKELVLHLRLEASSSDSGWYFCRIRQEIPQYSENTSNGTRVDITKLVEHTTLPSLVTEKKATQSVPDFFRNYLWLLILVGVSAFIVLLLICVLLKTRRCKKRAEQPIYANTKTNKKPMLNDTLKPIPCSQKVRKPKPSRRYDEG